jgi:sugar phosphate isomerase/epimerase
MISPQKNKFIMPYITRKEFLQTSAVLLTALATGSSFGIKKTGPLLSFSTLGCPDWTFQQITSFAEVHGYKGIEVRGIRRQMDLSKCPEFSTEKSREATVTLMKEKGLRFVGLGSSANLHFAEGMDRARNIAEAKVFIDLAQQINCPYIRVFPNKFPKEQQKAVTIDLIIKGLLELGDYAKPKNVTVLMETHGDVVKIDDLEMIMRSTEHSNLGLVWDISNMWAVTKEPPADAWKRLKKYIRHAHIKDAKLLADGKLQYTLPGQGDVPIFEAIDLLAKNGYKGFYSFEWEKMWHPEIAEPENALADYPKIMKKHFKN